MTWRTLALGAVLALLLHGCAATSSTERSSPTRSPVTQKPPFGAKQIRDAQWEGKTTIHRIEAADREPFYRVTKWVEVTEDYAGFQAIELDMNQQPIGEAMTAKATWGELVEHALFPAEATTVTETTVRVPAGEYDALLYTVKGREGGKESVMTLHFAFELPGPPVRMERRVDGERVYLMELVDPGRRDEP